MIFGGNISVFKQNTRKKDAVSERGRTLLEIIAVVAIMGVMSVGTIAFYKRIMNNHEAEALYEDFRVRSILYAGKKERSKFSTEMGKKTTYGNLAFDFRENNPDKGYFYLGVSGLKTALCDLLLKKNWVIYTSPDRSTKNQSLSALRIYIDNHAYAPEGLPSRCPSGDNVSFKVVYKMTYMPSDAELPDLCAGGCDKPCQACGENGECYFLCDDCDEDTGTCPEP